MHVCVERSQVVPAPQFGSARHATQVLVPTSQYASGGAQSPSPEQPAEASEPPAPPVAGAPPLPSPAPPPEPKAPPAPPVADVPPVSGPPPSGTRSPTSNPEKSLVQAPVMMVASRTFADAVTKPRKRIDLERYHGLENGTALRHMNQDKRARLLTFGAGAVAGALAMGSLVACAGSQPQPCATVSAHPSPTAPPESGSPTPVPASSPQPAPTPAVPATPPTPPPTPTPEPSAPSSPPQRTFPSAPHPPEPAPVFPPAASPLRGRAVD
jgi:hypothetical protein